MVERRSDNNQGTKTELAELKAYLIGLKFDIVAKLPDDLTPGEEKFALGYLRAQLRVTQGRRVRAQRIFDSLEKQPDYIAFEARNDSLLAAIDIAVRGNTNRKDWRDKPVKPLFTLDENS